MVATHPFVIVTGSGRSGTTLLRFMLDSHPDVAVPDEYNFIAFARYAGLPKTGPMDWRQALDTLERRPDFWRRWNLDPADVRRVVQRDQPGDLGAFERTLAQLYAETHGGSRAAVKTPDYATEIETLAQLHPDVRFVHMIRDGRDVVSSFKRVAFGPSSSIDAALTWRDRVQIARAAGAAVGPTRYLEVRYETLVSQPEGQLREICAFIDLPYHPDMLDHRERALTQSSRAGHESLSRPVAAPTTGWADTLSREDVVAVEVLAGGLLDDLGYERSGYRPSRRDWLTIKLRATSSTARSKLKMAKRRGRRLASRRVRGRVAAETH